MEMELERASTPLQGLVDNPLEFLKNNALELSIAQVPPEYVTPGSATFRPGNAYLKLVETRKGVYNLVFVPSSEGSQDKNCILAIVLGAVQNKGNDDVERVEIFRNNPTLKDKTFLFTVTLTGCSVVVTRLDNANSKYVVFHDRRMDSAVLYNNVEMCVNFEDYRIGGQYLTHTGQAITCMQFKAGVWKMYLQRQLPLPNQSSFELYASEIDPGTSRDSLEQKFNNRRARLQRNIKSNANLLGVDKSLIDGAKDGEYQGNGQYDDEAIRTWNELRIAIKKKIAERRKASDLKPSEVTTLNEFEDNATESGHMDETWVWLQIKKKTNKGPN